MCKRFYLLYWCTLYCFLLLIILLFIINYLLLIILARVKIYLKHDDGNGKQYPEKSSQAELDKYHVLAALWKPVGYQ